MPKIFSAEALLEQQKDLLNDQTHVSLKLQQMASKFAELSQDQCRILNRSFVILDRINVRSQYVEQCKDRIKKRKLDQAAAQRRIDSADPDVLAIEDGILAIEDGPSCAETDAGFTKVKTIDLTE